LPVEILPFLQWQARLDPRQLYSLASPPQYPVCYKDQFYYLEQLAAEGGRCVLVRQQSDGSKETLTADGFNIRSRVHEYGGKAFLLADEHIWFSNDVDRRIYKQELSPLALPEALTAADSQDMAIDFQLTADSKYLVFVQEHPVMDGENENSLCALSLHAELPARPYSLASGADFYANPVISPDGSQLAWIEWNHPQMPWDGSLLKTGTLRDEQGSLSIDPSSIEIIAGGVECAVCQLQYSPAGRLFFALDGRDDERGLQADCWDLYAWDGQSIERITNDDGEFGEAHWIFGQQRYVVLDEERIITATAVHACSTENKEISKWYSSEPLLDDADVSVPQHLTYSTSDGEHSHAWYYPPKNHLYQAPPDDKPPLLVMVHGGPTSRCDSALNYQRQYWTGRGFAVLDVNHRGSTGYCRSYRQSLQGQWGLMDGLDVANAVEYAIEQKLAHPQQICIRGGSAGGYLVLRALTLYPDLFCAGACYYGIGNLVTLMEFTHKFEAHYLDGLLAAPYHGSQSDQPGSPYYDRSPLHDLASLKSPMIVFQGLEVTRCTVSWFAIRPAWQPVL
jgi:dipeptidyl aminopeptidase/acylaminoacyl peptidase